MEIKIFLKQKLFTLHVRSNVIGVIISEELGLINHVTSVKGVAVCLSNSKKMDPCRRDCQVYFK